MSYDSDFDYINAGEASSGEGGCGAWIAYIVIGIIVAIAFLSFVTVK